MSCASVWSVRDVRASMMFWYCLLESLICQGTHLCAPWFEPHVHEREQADAWRAIQVFSRIVAACSCATVPASSLGGAGTPGGARAPQRVPSSRALQNPDPKHSTVVLSLPARKTLARALQQASPPARARSCAPEHRLRLQSRLASFRECSWTFSRASAHRSLRQSLAWAWTRFSLRALVNFCVRCIRPRNRQEWSSLAGEEQSGLFARNLRQLRSRACVRLST